MSDSSCWFYFLVQCCRKRLTSHVANWPFCVSELETDISVGRIVGSGTSAALPILIVYPLLKRKWQTISKTLQCVSSHIRAGTQFLKKNKQSKSRDNQICEQQGERVSSLWEITSCYSNKILKLVSMTTSQEFNICSAVVLHMKPQCDTTLPSVVLAQ